MVADPTSSTEKSLHKSSRMPVLDGWRAVSILFVLAAHMLPLGPKTLLLNSSAGLIGMAIFFTLSGFLITTTLLKHPSTIDFIIRRACRILPLAIIVLVIVLTARNAPWDYYLVYFSFLENYLRSYFFPTMTHFWSLCVEVHFYAFIAALSGMFGTKGLQVLPWLAILVTANKVATGSAISIETHLRVDEILVGATLALAFEGKLGAFGT